MRKQNILVIGILILGLGIISFLVVNRDDSSQNSSTQSSENLPSNIPSGLERQFDTDFSNTSLSDFGDIISGGPPKDGIPAISNPEF